MERTKIHEALLSIFWRLYPNNNLAANIRELIDEADDVKKYIQEQQDKRNTLYMKREHNWYQKAIVYETYVDLFNKDFNGMRRKLNYLQDLGITCIWLLPIFDSPMKDGGFDVRDYYKIRSSFARDLETFHDFVKEAHERGIAVLIDMPLNHTSNEHAWFQEAIKNPDSSKRNYYIWSNTGREYANAGICFQGIMSSNWSKEREGKNQYYFHRFFRIQPDLNYKNPEVLFEMCKIFMYWVKQGVDGFRADAITCLWKEDGTSCFSLEPCHTITKFIRALLDYIRPSTVILAEACHHPKDIAKYFGKDDECHAAYHFPLMAQIWVSLCAHKRDPVIDILRETPDIPDFSQWFLFLRCHDELTFEMLPPSQRTAVINYYLHEAKWDFRDKIGVSARVANLLRYDVERIHLSFSLLLTLLGTPILYYGDEFGMSNDDGFFDEMFKHSGIHDSRYYNRGRLNFPCIDSQLQNKNSLASKVFYGLKRKIHARKQFDWIGNSKLQVLDIQAEDGRIADQILGYLRIERTKQKEAILFIHNLKQEPCSIRLPFVVEQDQMQDILNKPLVYHASKNVIDISSYQYTWLHVDLGRKQIIAK